MGFIQRVRSEKALNDALDTFQSLRKFPEKSTEYLAHLFTVKSLCQDAISINQSLGDAYVLLANVYFLIYIGDFPQIRKSLQLWQAAAIIQHWIDEPISQYPSTNNTENGKKIYSLVSNALVETGACLSGNVQIEMKRLKDIYLFDALYRTL
jgi:hypothetical protein